MWSDGDKKQASQRNACDDADQWVPPLFMSRFGHHVQPLKGIMATWNFIASLMGSKAPGLILSIN